MSLTQPKTLIIWASDNQPPRLTGPVVLWQSFVPDEAPATWHSLPEFVRQNQQDLRTQYLSWLHDIGCRDEGGGSLVQRLKIREGLSYWWMTTPADFSLDVDSPAYTAVRMFALAVLVRDFEFDEVRLVGESRIVRELVGDWARRCDVPFSVSRGNSRDVRLWGNASELSGRLRQLVKESLPFAGAAWVAARHARFLLSRGNTGALAAHENGVTVVDYLAHFDVPVNSGGHFASRYWGPLVDLLEHGSVPPWWLHIAVGDAARESIASDSALIDQFNRHTHQSVHTMLQSAMTLRVLVHALLDYLRVVGMALRWQRLSRAFAATDGGASLWPAFRLTVRRSFFGAEAMRNCLWLNLFETTLAHIPHQRLGIYIFENQPWEIAMQHAWKRAGHGDLIGFAHATVLYWDTRYFKDSRDTYPENQPFPMPWPDRIAVNGPMMRLMCQGGGYPGHRLLDVEALRYLATPPIRGPRGDVTPVRLLVIGEYSTVVNHQLLSMVDAALRLLDFEVETTIRSHPALSSHEVEAFPEDSNSSLGDAIAAADLVVCGAFSSAAVEAVIGGSTVVLVREARAFDANPAEGIENATGISSAVDLANELRRTRVRRSQQTLPSQPVFNLDSELPKWRVLLHGD